MLFRSGKSLTLDLAPGQRRTVTMPDTADDQPQIAGIELLGDPHPFDNVVDLPVQQPKLRRILHAGSTDPNDEESMRYYLQRVFDGQEAESLELSDLMTTDGVSVPPPEGSRLALLTDTLPENLVDPLRRMTEAGGVILAAVKSVAMAESLKRLLQEGLTWTEAEVADYAILTTNDLNSRLLAPFADSQIGRAHV